MVKAVIFDVDGTLLDSVDLHALSWHEAMARFGHSVSFEQVRSQIGKGGDKLIPEFLSIQDQKDHGKELENWRGKRFKSMYLPLVRPFSAVPELRQRARHAGLRIAVGTSAKSDELDSYLGIAGIADLVDVKTSSGDAEESKPAADIFESALAKLGCSPRDTVAIGDTPYDAEAAINAGIMSIGVLCGGFTEASLAYARPEALKGIHINMVNIFAEDAVPTTSAEKDFVARRAEILDRKTGYNHQQSTRPQTLGVAMADSPVGAAGWILEKFGAWADLAKLDNGDPDLWNKFSKEKLLTNIMLYVAPSAVVTATWIYRGRRLERSGKFPAGARIKAPLGVAAFPDPVFLPMPRSFVEKTYDVVHWTEMPKGGHFAALEEPDLMLADLRAFVRKVA